MIERPGHNFNDVLGISIPENLEELGSSISRLGWFFQMSNDQNPACLEYIIGDIPVMWGLQQAMIRFPIKTTSTMECHKGFDYCSAGLKPHPTSTFPETASWPHKIPENSGPKNHLRRLWV